MKITGTSKAFRRSLTASRPELPSASWISARIRPGRLVGGELHRFRARAGDAGHVVAEAFDERLEIHGDQRLVLDDQDVGRHVGGEFAPGLVDEFANRLRRRRRGSRPTSSSEKPSRQESRNA